MTVQINVLSTTLLGLLLLPLLRRTTIISGHRPVLEFVGSAEYSNVEADWLDGGNGLSILQHINLEATFKTNR